MAEILEEMERSSRSDIFNLLRDEIIDEAIEHYAENYAPGEEISGGYGGPMVQTDSGITKARDIDSAKYRVTGRDWDIDFEVSIIESPYDIHELTNNKEGLDYKKFVESLKSPNSGSEKSRIVNLSPETEWESYSQDRWFCFEKSLREILKPREVSSPNSFDFVYHFNLENLSEGTVT